MSRQELAATGKAVGDLTSIGIALGTLANLLPAVAALFTIVWTSIRIWETPTVQSWIGRWKEGRRR
jgi:hypothetical protein